MGIKLGKLSFNVFLSVKRVVSDAPEIVYDVLCNVCFAGWYRKVDPQVVRSLPFQFLRKL